MYAVIIIIIIIITRKRLIEHIVALPAVIALRTIADGKNDKVLWIDLMPSPNVPLQCCDRSVEFAFCVWASAQNTSLPCASLLWASAGAPLC